jgi:hypothetical protein
MRVGRQRHAPAALFPVKTAGTHYQEGGWSPGPVWTATENLVPSGFDPRTVQPVTSRYTDWAIAVPLRRPMA